MTLSLGSLCKSFVLEGLQPVFRKELSVLGLDDYGLFSPYLFARTIVSDRTTVTAGASASLIFA